MLTTSLKFYSYGCSYHVHVLTLMFGWLCAWMIYMLVWILIWSEFTCLLCQNSQAYLCGTWYDMKFVFKVYDWMLHWVCVNVWNMSFVLLILIFFLNLKHDETSVCCPLNLVPCSLSLSSIWFGVHVFALKMMIWSLVVVDMFVCLWYFSNWPHLAL